MPEDERPGSEEYAKFRTAMQDIVAVRKVDIVEDLPKMFRDRKPAKKTAGKKRAAKKARS
jgi:hypothetical protein